MKSGKEYLNNMFDRLSSIYRKDNSMLNSNLYVILNAYSEVFDDVQRKTDQVKDNTYITSADPDALESNFGTLIDFPKPPRLNTVANGDESYRFILLSLFQNFMSGSTISTMESSLNEVISLLTTDPSTTDTLAVTNYTYLGYGDRELESGSIKIELTDRAVSVSGTQATGPASISDISIFPSGSLTISSYTDSSKTIEVDGVIDTGTQYQISYFRDNTSYQGTSWMNLTNRGVTNVSPLDLMGGTVDTYNNPEFSYWWNNYNVDGSGVSIDEFEIIPEESSLIWRLPSKAVRFTSPYDGRRKEKGFNFYNNSGTSFDIETISDINPDVEFTSNPVNYQDEVSGKSSNYYIRYSNNNNGPNVALSEFDGSFNKYIKKIDSVEFQSSNFGPLDFFESGTGFDINDLFGYGTKNAWINVQNFNGEYILNNNYLAEREFSLHQDILWEENFESANLNNVSFDDTDDVRISESPSSTLRNKENSLLLSSQSSGSTTSAYPIIPTGIVSSINRVEIDFFDPLNSGTSSYIDTVITGSNASDYRKFRFGIDNSGSITLFNEASGDIDDTKKGELEDDFYSQSKPYGFVNTYFPSSGSTDYALSLDAVTTGVSYSLISGNQNIESDYSMTVGDTTDPNATVEFNPNVDASVINDIDTIKIQFYNPGSGTRFSLSMNGYEDLGGGVYATKEFEMGFFDNSIDINYPNWSWSSLDHQKIVSSVFGVPQSSVTAGGWSMPIVTGVNTLVIKKDEPVSLNGTDYPIAPSIDQNRHDIFGSFSTKPSGTLSYGPITDFDIGNAGSIQFKETKTAAVDIRYTNFEVSNSDLKLNYESDVSRFLADPTVFENIDSQSVPYYYQVFSNADEISQPKKYITGFSRKNSWQRLRVDMNDDYRGIKASLGDGIFYNNSDIGFSGSIAPQSGISLNHNTNYPNQEFSYYDNIELSYFDTTQTLDKYDASLVPGDWEGSMLSQSTILDNKFFKLEPVANFQFNVEIKGLDETYIHIVNKIINKVKPAHTLAVPIFVLEQSLDTTETVATVANVDTDWETGNITNNIEIKSSGGTISSSSDKPGFIVNGSENL